MVYPACSPTLNSDLRVAPTSQYSSVYDVPGLLLPYENCQTAMGIPDAACVERNLITEHLNFQRTADYREPVGAQSTAPIWSTQPSATGAHPASVAFSPGSGATLYPGDNWNITVLGPPNAAVSVTGGKDGSGVTAQMGSTDSGGAFRIAGSITADQVGRWNEQWTVGGQNAGSISFTVAPARTSGSGGTQTGGTGTGGGTAPGGGTGGGTGRGAAAFDPMTLLWIGGAIVALFLATRS
jgi:hypothetical protein